MGNKEFKSTYVEDFFYEKGHAGLKMKQICITIFAWLLFFTPFVLVLFPILFFKQEVIVLAAYQTAARMFRTMGIIFSVAIIFIIVLFIILTYVNNARYEKILNKKITFNEETLAIRKLAVEEFVTERFGDKKTRESQKYISIPGDKNLDVTSYRDLYEKKGVPLK
ncbi:hypothetical protein HCA55_03595 [Listeria booriae]|uniref:Cell division protein n=1 Tax=Listeria booriae TaxID=1552123 RepID=A0A7X0XYP8_9LIST|nr:hypothetical protein [Listeria booriae]MBC1794198.1 hypothetical protein [Listeria booriae]MBC1795792.1 hypothetical protein [Listeria booriae]MBC1800107.1 hypothetical protein [Listeria booriae]MBC1805365.1 hypothetical protein [Listeria booriae]MBC1813611.1 hypothetical protein [Listeria booriae]